MDPSRSSGRRGRGGKGGGGSRLGMKMVFSPTPPASSFSPSPTSFLSASPAPPSSSPAPAPAEPSSSPPQGAGVPPRPAQGVGLGAMPPNFPYEQGNQQAPNLWSVYPPGGFTNLLQQPQHLPHPHMQGQNFYFVGQTMSFNPISPPAPPKETVNIDIEEGENSEANRAVKKRYWTHEEETRLASAWLNVSKDPIRGNDQKYDTFWKEITEEFLNRLFKFGHLVLVCATGSLKRWPSDTCLCSCYLSDGSCK